MAKTSRSNGNGVVTRWVIIGLMLAGMLTGSAMAYGSLTSRVAAVERQTSEVTATMRRIEKRQVVIAERLGISEDELPD